MWELHRSRTTWVSDEVLIKVQTSWEDTTETTVNLMNTIGVVQAIKRTTTNDDFYWLPQNFSRNDTAFRQNVLIPYFVKPCVDGGFNLMSKGWEKQGSLIKFVCNRGRHHKGSAARTPSSKPDVVTKTCRPIRGETDRCTFGFKVYWKEENHRWCFPKQQAGCKEHTGHTHREPHECRLYTKDYGEDALQTILDALSSLIRPSQIVELINAQTGHTMSNNQIVKLKQKFRETTEIRMDAIEAILGGGPMPVIENPTPADQLLSELESNGMYSYTLLYSQWDSDELTIYRRDKAHGIRERQQVDPRSVSDDPVEDMETYSRKIRDRLSITGSGYILLALAWTTNSAQRKFEMYPEFTCSDVTHGTNAERRPLLLFSGKDGHNKAFTQSSVPDGRH